MGQQSSLPLFQDERKYIKGVPVHTIFHNKENYYTVVRIRVQETNESVETKEMVVKGYFPKLHMHEPYLFFGSFQEHPKYGLQYDVAQFRKDLPQTKQGMIQYLSGDLFEGIGKKTAQNIVEALGEHAITKILEDRGVLETVPRLSEEKADLLYETLMEHQGLEQIMIALSDYGFGPQLSMKIYQAYEQETLEVVRSNPYQLVQDVEGVGFRRADELGKSLGLSGNHPERVRAGCLYWLEEKALSEGHVYMPVEHLLPEVQHLLAGENGEEETVEEGDINRQLAEMDEEGKVVMEEERVYLPSLYYAEKGVVAQTKRIVEQPDFDPGFSEAEFLKALGGIEERLGIQYAPSQKEAIQRALLSPYLLLTGGPGTGKTTVIQGIVELYAELHGLSLNPDDYRGDDPFPIILVAPTGRAAKRMKEATGLPAFTIHRLLGWKGGHSGFEHDRDNPIEGKLLIVDEVSMVDIWLANQLFKSLPDDIQVVVVGDQDQLPSVGPGQVLRDLLRSEVIPTVNLTDIYRQAEGSSIVQLAHSIKDGRLPDDFKVPKKDRRFFDCTQVQVADVVKQVCENARQKGYSAKQIQVLAPIYRGSAGVERLNKELQELFNPKAPGKRELFSGDVMFRSGDKVLQLVNHPDQHVFNGDIGEVAAISYAKENADKQDKLIVSFDGTEVAYTKQDFNQIALAYCCSIHKSQGSEFPIVVLPVVRGYSRMLKRNLIYTAVTRSKEYLILCGEEQSLTYAIRRENEDDRNTMLEMKLREQLASVDPESA
ncbi:MAG TPA: ATP-dependent RecD-like DNA helicase [Bacillales bacterium]|nr:ATP-dependent RecD-like DNA helicase [Bacillales bacterium]